MIERPVPIGDGIGVVAIGAQSFFEGKYKQSMPRQKESTIVCWLRQRHAFVPVRMVYSQMFPILL